MASHYTDKEVRVIAIIDSNMTSNLSEASFEQVFKGIVDKLYFVDMGSSITAFSKIVEGEDNELMDAIINIGDVKGSETLASLLVKNKGFIFHTGMKSGYYQSIIATDCLGKEVTTYALDGYADGSYEFAIEMVKKLKENIKDAEAVLSKIPKNELRQKITKTVTDNMEVKEVDGFIFMSPITEEVVDTAINIAAYDCNVIIQGETGVGKEKILNLIHKHSPRRDKPCIRVNCATIQENLAESEFFGYEKGSFTGAAASGKIGYFELANNGTLFLDEIGSLPLSMQSKLLRVLQENSYYRVGGTEEKHTNVRVICANNIPLKQLVDEGKFREDLYYRLNICLIDVPPLRKRKEDVYCLADFFIKNYSKKYGVEKCFSYEALRRLSNYQWPGNVRELENAVHRLYITEKNTVIEESDVDRFLDDSIYDDLIVDIKKAVTSDENMDFSRIMDEQEKRLISYALEKEKTTRKAAEFLKIPQATFARKKLKHNL
jgi:transcriptional regulator with PAS, ATPase and Fis domain